MEELWLRIQAGQPLATLTGRNRRGGQLAVISGLASTLRAAYSSKPGHTLWNEDLVGPQVLAVHCNPEIVACTRRAAALS